MPCHSVPRQKVDNADDARLYTSRRIPDCRCHVSDWRNGIAQVPPSLEAPAIILRIFCFPATPSPHAQLRAPQNHEFYQVRRRATGRGLI